MMKYKRLSKEQFEELHVEFATFLASQQIDAREWTEIKEIKPEMAEEELDLFSDMVWEDVLGKVKYLEHFSEKVINLFKSGPGTIKRIVVQVNKPDFNFLNRADFQWFIENTNDTAVSFFKGEKNYEGERNSELFDLIQKGSIISEGSLYESIINLLLLEKK